MSALRPPLPAQITLRTVPALLANRVRSSADTTALLGASASARVDALTYRQLGARAAAVAGGLAALEVTKGGRVASLLTNAAALEGHVLYHATHRLGAINVPLNTRYRARELRYVLEHAAPRVLVLESKFREVAEEALAGNHVTPTLVYVTDARAGESSWASLFEHGAAPQTPISEHDSADWIFTSGTTGNPKAVEHTHATSVACGIQVAHAWDLRASDVYQSFSPFFTSTGCHTNLLSCLWVGCTYKIDTEFDVQAFPRSVADAGTTVCFLVSSALLLLLDAGGWQRQQFSSLRRLLYAGLAMPLAFHRQVDETFRASMGTELVHLMGLTEGGPTGLYLPPEHHQARLGSIGDRGFSRWTQFAVRDESDRDVGRGDTGELCLRSPSIMVGYANDPDATAAALRGNWLHTGDLVRLDDAGFAYFVDRRKDVIRRGGLTIASAEVEGVLGAHPAVLEVAVVPKPHRVLGEDVRAVVVLRPGAVASAEDLLRHCREQLADYKVPREISFVDVLPRNAMGKVMKHVLREATSPPEDVR